MHSEGQYPTQAVPNNVGGVRLQVANEPRERGSIFVQRTPNGWVVEQVRAHAVLTLKAAFDQVHAGAMGEVPMHANDRFSIRTQFGLPSGECPFP